MEIRVRLFAVAREAVGRESITVELPDGATIGSLRLAMVESFPQLSHLIDSMMFARDTGYVVDETPLATADEIACIPPVSGG